MDRAGRVPAGLDAISPAYPALSAMGTEAVSILDAYAGCAPMPGWIMKSEASRIGGLKDPA